MKRFIHYLNPYLLNMSLGLAIKFVGTMMDLLIPWILAYIIDSVVPLKSTQLILFWGFMMILAASLALFANIIANRMASRVAKDTIQKIRHDLFRKISYLSNAQIDGYTLPSLISRLTADTYNVHHMIGMMQRLGVRAPILLLGGVLITMTLDPILSLILIAILPLITLTVLFISKKGIPLYETLQKNIDAMVRVLRENITGVRVIKALSKGDYEKERFFDINHNVRKAERHVGITMGLSNPLMNLLLNAGLSIVVLVGAVRVNSGHMTPGVIIAFLTYFTLILNAMLSISRIFILASKGSASFNRIIEVLDTPEDLVQQSEDYINSGNHIEFNSVTFSYYKQTPNLKNISFSLKRGESLGIIGATGSGKSSIIKLLLRLYDADKGTIRIDGHNIKSLAKEKLHTLFGIVFQDDMLFADTIKENISFGRHLDYDELFMASHMAQAGSFIDSLAEGFNHQLDIKGANLSGGQKQRLLISRALASKPEILILDDASSALDYRTDANLRFALNKHYEETTVIIVAQRISSIMHCTKIIALEDGGIIGYGTHSELLHSCPVYRQISAIQLGETHEITL
jgi:ATP-binding cassette subfamily B multidrug efflux pump